MAEFAGGRGWGCPPCSRSLTSQKSCKQLPKPFLQVTSPRSCIKQRKVKTRLKPIRIRWVSVSSLQCAAASVLSWRLLTSSTHPFMVLIHHQEGLPGLSAPPHTFQSTQNQTRPRRHQTPLGEPSASPDSSPLPHPPRTSTKLLS